MLNVIFHWFRTQSPDCFDEWHRNNWNYTTTTITTTTTLFIFTSRTIIDLVGIGIDIVVVVIVKGVSFSTQDESLFYISPELFGIRFPIECCF